MWQEVSELLTGGAQYLTQKAWLRRHSFAQQRANIYVRSTSSPKNKQNVFVKTRATIEVHTTDFLGPVFLNLGALRPTSSSQKPIGREKQKNKQTATFT